METIQFAVSAKTARLIGRENISGVDGAVIELIKNSYDADATCSLVIFDMPFPVVPSQISFDIAASLFSGEDYKTLLVYYRSTEKGYWKRPNLTLSEEADLSDFLFSFNKIVVIDNGEGMSEHTLRTSWMNIGTNEKDENSISPKGRKKTGAKGIGRFALDKLSRETTVFTQAVGQPLLKWHISWDQFETADMLNDISATMEDLAGNFREKVEKIAAGKLKTFDRYQWSTGTIIVLNPTREAWASIYFQKLNSELRNIFPEVEGVRFDTYIENSFFPEYSFQNERFQLADDQYDYKITGSFDGTDQIRILLSRNEIDTRKRTVDIVVGDEKHTVPLSEFWQRERFQLPDYRRADFAKTIGKTASAIAETKCTREDILSVGPFELELYFLKNTNSKNGIVKHFDDKARKSLLEKSSGIKLYRDGFKVRPYGEAGSGFDWLGLGDRVTRSPGAVKRSGAWRVRTNQILGFVKISRENNPFLTDMANREGLALNSAYETFVKIILAAIETFEADRQIVFSEYSNWVTQKEKQFSKTNEIIRELEDRKAQRQKDDRQKAKPVVSGYSSADVEQAVIELHDEQNRKDRAMKTMMLYSSAGVMTSTFSHEINRITSDMGSRIQQLRYTVKRLVGEQGYVGDPAFDPFIIMRESENVDKILESWLDVIMNGAEANSFLRKRDNIYKATEKVLNVWRPLMNQKLIEITLRPLIGREEDAFFNFSDADLYIVLNNFLLNSAWFLENVNHEREIVITIEASRQNIVLVMENNGPVLDPKYANNPERIFYPGESTKETNQGEGTGLGLWIVNTIIEELSGTIMVSDKKDGFGLRITLPKS